MKAPNAAAPFPQVRLRGRLCHACKCCQVVTLSLDAGQCWPCQPNAVLIWTWLRYTPDFTVAVAVLSSPVSLMIALWGMLSYHDRQLLLARCTACRAYDGSDASPSDGKSVAFIEPDISLVAIIEGTELPCQERG